MDIKIIKLENERWKEYRDLRLDAIEHEPEAFWPSLEESQLSDEKWQNVLYGDPNVQFFFAEYNGRIVGMIKTRLEGFKKVSHNGWIYSFYVLKEFRQKGIATMLLKQATAFLEEMGARSIFLNVAATQEDAIYLYKKMGFVQIGSYKNFINVKGIFYDEYIMGLYLK